MAEGRLPPKGFNMGNLCLFPKDSSFRISRTRPITLNNVINRLVAAVVSDAIMPAVDAIAHPNQKGFIRGRLGEDNIFDVTNSFYGELIEQRQKFFLLIDTAKAFDSLDHPYLFAVLEHIGMPQWVINVITALMDQVRVRPLFALPTRTTIPILRGVKQGCPLSPILFIIAYDPLLHRLSSIPGAKVWAFADDAAISHSSLTDMARVTEEIDAFSSISGFGINRDKSFVLHTLPTSPADQTALDAFGWEGLSFTTRGVYLGVLIGVDVGTDDVFNEAYNKYLARLRKYSSALAHLSIQTKFFLFNTYLLPLFYYLCKFYIFPEKENLGAAIRNTIRRSIISFNGGAFKYVHLIAPTSQLGFTTPLRDLYAHNLALLANQFDYTTLVGEQFAHVPARPYLNNADPDHPLHNTNDKRDWNTMLIPDHVATAALDYANSLLPLDDNDCVDYAHFHTSRYKHPNRRLRQRLYKTALIAWAPVQRADLQLKFTKRQMLGALTADHCADNYAPSPPIYATPSDRFCLTPCPPTAADTRLPLYQRAAHLPTPSPATSAAKAPTTPHTS